MSAGAWLLVLLALAGVLLGFAIGQLRVRPLRARRGSAAPEAEAAPVVVPLKCEIRLYLYADGSECVAHTLCDDASEDAARERVGPDGPELVEVRGIGTHEL